MPFITAKLLGVSTPTVQDWIERFAEAYAQKPEPEGRAVVVELDEMWHYLKKSPRSSGSGRLGIALRYGAAHRLGLGAALPRGGRDGDTCAKLVERLKRWGTRLYCADGWAAYAELIPQGRLHVGKNETHGIERDHARQRHWLARFRRRSIVVSKARRMVDASIALFARFGSNDKIGDLLSMLT